MKFFSKETWIADLIGVISFIYLIWLAVHLGMQGNAMAVFFEVMWLITLFLAMKWKASYEVMRDMRREYIHNFCNTHADDLAQGMSDAVLQAELRRRWNDGTL